MSYLNDFEHDFMRHTLQIIRDYSGRYNATILINCLVGLLVVPREQFMQSIPNDSVSLLKDWGINPDSIKSFGDRAKDLRQLVRSLRNSIAHFRIKPIPSHGKVKCFHFTDKNGFDAKIELSELRDFVERLAKHLDKS